MISREGFDEFAVTAADIQPACDAIEVGAPGFCYDLLIVRNNAPVVVDVGVEISIPMMLPDCGRVLNYLVARSLGHVEETASGASVDAISVLREEELWLVGSAVVAGHVD